MKSHTELSSADYEAILDLFAELAELTDSAPESAFGYLTSRIEGLLGDVTVGFAARARRHPSCGWEMTDAVMQGLTPAQLLHWRRAFLADGGYRAHPLWPRLAPDAGALRTFVRRQLVPDQEWYSHPIIADGPRSLGFDDVVISVLPIGADREFILSISRPWGDRPFDERHRRIVETLNQRLGWFYRRAPWQEGATPIDRNELARRIADLPPRHHHVLRLLLTADSEKEIAARLRLSPATIHKYIEQVYRALGVTSRPQLMAYLLSPRAELLRGPA